MAEREPPPTQVMNVSDARHQFSQLLNRVFRREARVIVEKHGIPVAAIVSAEDLARLRRLDAERQERFGALEASWAAFGNVPVDEIAREVDRALAEVRRERREESDRPGQSAEPA